MKLVFIGSMQKRAVSLGALATMFGSFLASLLLCLFVPTGAATAVTLSGVARVIDGDTIILEETRIRLKGIDAPETDQICLDAKRERWTCGIEARDRLKEHIAGRELSCVDSGNDRYGR